MRASAGELTNYRAYTSALHTKRLVYYSRRSFLTVELHSSSDWRTTSPNTHRDRFLVRSFVRKANIFALCDKRMNLGRNFHVCARAFRLAAYVIRLTMVLQYTTFVRRPREEACMHEKSINAVYCRACLPFITKVFA